MASCTTNIHDQQIINYSLIEHLCQVIVMLQVPDSHERQLVGLCLGLKSSASSMLVETVLALAKLSEQSSPQCVDTMQLVIDLLMNELLIDYPSDTKTIGTEGNIALSALTRLFFGS